MALPAVLALWLLAPALLPSGAGHAPTAASAAEPGQADEASDAVIVRFRDGAEPAERATARRAARTEFERALPLSGLQLVDPEPGVTVRQAVERLERSENVLYAEPDVLRSATRLPSDPNFGQQWGLHNYGQRVGGISGTADADIDLPAAWDQSTGSADVAVGVLDSGIDLDHPDLAPNIRLNPGASGPSGWDWVDDDNDPEDRNGHGTHVAGTLGASGNDGRGVAGVAWRVGLVPLRVLDENGSGRVSDIVAAYQYAARAKLRIVNASLAGASFSQAEYDAIRAAPEVLVVVAAGNDAKDNDVSGTYPCNNPLPNLVCVAASDQVDGLAAESSYGRGTVDLAAPGVNVMSTLPGGRWGLMSGTSMATPHVAGTAALIWSRWPDSSVAAVRAALLASVDAKPFLAGRTVTGGRLNAERALATPPSEAAFPPDWGVDPARQHGSSPVEPVAGHDGTPPSLSTRFFSRPRLRRVLLRGVPVRARCSEACSVRLELTLPRASAADLQIVSPTVVVARARGRLDGASSKTIRVQLAGRGRRLLRRVRARTVTLRARAVDLAGNATTVRRSLRLRR
jgi:large repetitive protein